MRIKTLQTSFNFLIEARLYQRLKMTAGLKKTGMSKIAREGIELRLDQIDKENNAVIQGGQE